MPLFVPVSRPGDELVRREPPPPRLVAEQGEQHGGRRENCCRPREAEGRSGGVARQTSHGAGQDAVNGCDHRRCVAQEMEPAPVHARVGGCNRAASAGTEQQVPRGSGIELDVEGTDAADGVR